MTTDCIDTRAVSGATPTLDLKITDRHLKTAVLAAVALVIFVLPAALAAASLAG
ncbi:MAG TPA: hypothetical protein VFH92_05425 [Phenylobacterium sp.]|nr:hypothetical protein [Phenylobacterium sp.]